LLNGRKVKTMATVDVHDLESAMLLLDADQDAQAWICRSTGAVLIRSDEIGEPAVVLPDNVDDDAYSRRFLARAGSTLDGSWSSASSSPKCLTNTTRCTSCSAIPVPMAAIPDYWTG